MGEGPLKNRPETVVSRSSIVIKPSEPVERNHHAPPAETINWKSHGGPSDGSAADARHVTLRSAWKRRRDLNSTEGPSTRIGKSVESSSAYTQRSSTDSSDLEQPRSHLSEQGPRRVGNAGDAPELPSRRTQSSLTASEVLARRNRGGDAVTAAAWNHSAGMEEGDDCTLSVHRRLHNALELPAKQGLSEPGRVRPEDRLRPSRPCAEEN